MCPEQRIGRRDFLRFVLNGGLLALVGGALYPILKYLYPPKGEQATVTSVVAAKTDELVPNSAKIFRFGKRPGILIHTPLGQLKAFSAVCTHLNCTVQYESESSIIWCACHNGKFDLNGQVISGPPPRPLESYQVKVVSDQVIVSNKPA